MELIFWISLTILFYTDIGYPIVLNLLPKNRIKISDLEEFPSITVCIPAFNEEKVIEETILNKLAQDYPKDKVKIIVRSLNNLPENWIYNCYLRITIASILDLSREEINMLVKDCDAVVSCLGHNLSFKGIYGQPRMLVKDAVTKICNAIIENEPFKPVKFLLMNTSGNSNRDLNEPISFAQKCVISILNLAEYRSNLLFEDRSDHCYSLGPTKHNVTSLSSSR